MLPSFKDASPATGENFPAVFADSALEASFSRDGYVVLPFFGPEEIEKSKKLYFANLSEPETDFFTTAFLPNGEPRRNVKEGLEAMIAPRVAELMPGYATCVRHFIVKRGHPDAESLGLHQDFNFVDQSVTRAVHVWIALTDVDEHNGCLTVLPGSHRLTFHISAMGLNATPYEPYRDVLEADCRIGVPMKAGEAFFFDERTLHGSYPNRSAGLRIAAGAVFLPKGVKQRLYVTDAVEPGLLDILEVESESLLDYSAVMRPPYPEGFKKIGTVEYIARPLSREVVQRLRRAPATVPAASLGVSRFFARLFGRHDPKPWTLANLESTLSPPSPTAAGLWVSVRSFIARRFASSATKPMVTGSIQDPPIRDARITLTAHTPEDVKRYYEEKTAAYLDGFGEVFQGSRPASTDELLDYIIEAAGLTDGLRILDAGCGVCGPSIHFAQKRQLAIEAVTISPTQVREAQKRIDALHLNGRIKVREGDFHRLAQIYEPNSFDRVLFLETICHARDYRSVIEQAMHILKPGGLLYIKDFYCQDFSSKPDSIETQLEDLRALNRVYCLVLPDLVSLLGLVSELGLMLEYLRKPGYNAVFEPWINFDRVTGVAWTPKLPYFELIAGMELCCRKPMPRS